jgi:hypothetical protein
VTLLEDFVLSVVNADEMPALKCPGNQALKLSRPKGGPSGDGRPSFPPDEYPDAAAPLELQPDDEWDPVTGTAMGADQEIE